MNQNPEQEGMKRIPVHQFLRRKKASVLLALGAAVSVLFSAPARPADLEKGDFSLDLHTRFPMP